MNNNDVLRRIRYILDLSDSKLISVFAHVDFKVNRQQVSSWLKKEEDADRIELDDVNFAAFLSGLIIHRRGKKEGATPELEQQLSNNIVFRKLKIAFDLKAEDILNVLTLSDFNLSKHELSAFFRKPGHKHYRKCQDQVLRNFLSGLQIKFRNTAPIHADSPWKQ